MTSLTAIPKIDVNIRLATLADVPFIDALQKKFGKQLGFMADSWLAARIAKEEVLIAEGAGYIIFQDKYLRREELGLIVQLCVDPSRHRGLIGAMLVRAAFERAAYGCRLFCLWCAQDIEANRFWESIGFVPLAYRAGSEKKARVHIFWQKRIREGDTTTPWWFPSKTDQGAMRADRIVLPIPLDRHWSDELPVLQVADAAKPALTDKRAGKTSKSEKVLPRFRPRQFDGPSAGPEPEAVVEKPKRETKQKAKADPKLIAAARELRDRWLEQVNAGEMLIESQGKYVVSRQWQLTATAKRETRPVGLLPAA
jgi:N-acetylglutamate synthase-like GNAT family acetyltransferase